MSWRSQKKPPWGAQEVRVVHMVSCWEWIRSWIHSGCKAAKEEASSWEPLEVGPTKSQMKVSRGRCQCAFWINGQFVTVLPRLGRCTMVSVASTMTYDMLYPDVGSTGSLSWNEPWTETLFPTDMQLGATGPSHKPVQTTILEHHAWFILWIQSIIGFFPGACFAFLLLL